MSSSNLVRVTAIEETVYGVTPVAGNFETVRFTSEELSGTPETTESKTLRTDRLSSGQVVVGQTVGGAVNFELAKETVVDKFMESAMHSSWSTMATVVVDLEIDTAAKEIIRSTGSWITDGIVKGDIIVLSGFLAAGNNDVPFMVTSVDSATVIKFVGPDGVVSEVGSGTDYTRADKLSIGTTKKSYSIEKKFTDLTTKGINYRGMIVDEMNLDVSFGDLINASFTFQGNNQEVADTAGELITNGRTINAPATTQSMNGSVDMPFIASSAAGTFDASNIDIQAISINLKNNLSAQTAIGNVAPTNYSSGTAQVAVEMSTYLTDVAWTILPKKLTQEPFEVGFVVKNAGGFYGFYMPAVQVSFDDPASGGQNQDVVLEMSGQAKVSSTGGSSLVIYRYA